MYHFRREDDGQLVEIDFAAMMEKDELGFITLPDGVRARQVSQPAIRSRAEKSGDASSVNRPILSDALGFPAAGLDDFERDRVANGFTGIEFVPDKGVPQFMQVKCSSPEQWRRYVQHRGARDQNSRNGSGATLTREQLERAAELATRGSYEKVSHLEQVCIDKRFANANDVSAKARKGQ